MLNRVAGFWQHPKSSRFLASLKPLLQLKKAHLAAKSTHRNNQPVKKETNRALERGVCAASASLGQYALKRAGARRLEFTL